MDSGRKRTHFSIIKQKNLPYNNEPTTSEPMAID